MDKIEKIREGIVKCKENLELIRERKEEYVISICSMHTQVL